jgi:3-hydroxyisobutyrate dehydrogenase-like beta-hydroxyacid dehydrogenase
MGRKIGLVGTGLMGRGMARSLLRQGHDLKIYNRTRSKAEEVAQSGGTVVRSPGEAAQGSQVVLTMLSDPPAVLETVEGPGGILGTIGPGAVLIDSSTISPAVTLRIGEKLKAKGAHMLDAPVFGSKNEAEKGELGFMVGGDPEVLESVKDVFLALGKSVRHIGPSGAGSTAKLVFNLIVAVTLEAFNEGMALATRAGIDPQLMYEVLQSGRARSGIAEMKGPQILKRDFSPFFHLRLMNKDLELALEAAHGLDVPMPALAATKQVLSACMGAGQGEEDFCAIVKYFEKAIGRPIQARKP